MPEPDAPILFYDGECGLCARSVQWCLDHDRRGRLRFAALQGATFAALDAPGKPADLETAVVLERGVLRVRGDAVIALLREVGGPWPCLALLLRLVPRFARDAVYRQVARRRHAMVPAAGRCRLPSPAESARFLA